MDVDQIALFVRGELTRAGEQQFALLIADPEETIAFDGHVKSAASELLRSGREDEAATLGQDSGSTVAFHITLPPPGRQFLSK